jgi:hypothetical protein
MTLQTLSQLFKLIIGRSERAAITRAWHPDHFPPRSDHHQPQHKSGGPEDPACSAAGLIPFGHH